MSRYLKNIKAKSTHERRQHAAQVAGGAVGVLALMWLASFSVRLPQLTAGAGEVAGAVSDSQSQLANVLSGRPAQPSSAQLEVSTTSVLQQ
ncbi:MAG: hypothetical protein JWO43_630 [Candidatus Adlerbacteria bacterium]|nr:hypothetical protein [Candidatus Adlerbacteria bacterium]